MKRFSPERKLAWIFLFWILSLAPAWAFQPFVIHNIRVEGLQRLEKGTVLTYLPLSAGDTVTQSAAQNAVRALYNTGLFQDVQLERGQGANNQELIVKVKERPAISSFKLEGNKKIGGKKLIKALHNAGLARGRLFKRSLLESVEQELRSQYYSNGYYSVQIKPTVQHLSNNRVSITINVKEGPVAKIRGINIVGNKAFSKQTLLGQFKLSTPTALSFITKNDLYSRGKLVGDLESLTSFYQDHGYLNFAIDSVQVELSPDKTGIYVTINVSEGQQYTIRKFSLSGRLVVKKSELESLVKLHPGEQYSQRKVSASSDAIETRLADDGYAFAKVQPKKHVVPGTHKVDIDFQVKPGQRVYVRRITFSGNYKTNDQTLRRELRQYEGAWYSRAAIQRSRTRLARLPFIEQVKVNTKRVQGSNDMVDVSFDVNERPPGAIQLGVGYSGSQGILLSGSITHNNFLGTGNKLSLRVDNSSIYRVYSASWTDPYATTSGVSRTVTGYYRSSNQIIRYSSDYDTKQYGGKVLYSFPLSEFSSFQLGGTINQTELKVYPGTTSTQVIDFTNQYGKSFLEYMLNTGWSYDTRNKTILATRGSLNQISLDMALPGSDLTYYKGTYNYQQYVPLPADFTIHFNGTLGYEHGYGGGNNGAVPPYDHFYAGGFDTVRGFTPDTLGPQDTFNNPLGGTFETVLQTGLILPTPLKSNNKSTRFTLFYDMGSVFAQPGDWQFSKLRSSAGVAFSWFTPFLGVLRLSYAVPIRTQPGDNIQHFQFSFGTGF